MAAACWFVTVTFPLTAAPEAPDAPGISVDLGGAAVLHRAPVQYPEAARKQGVQGTVTLELTTDSSGNVSDARVLSGPVDRPWGHRTVHVADPDGFVVEFAEEIPRARQRR